MIWLNWLAKKPQIAPSLYLPSTGISGACLDDEAEINFIMLHDSSIALVQIPLDFPQGYILIS